MSVILRTILYLFALAATAYLATPCLAAPTIFWASDPVGPDETVLITGDRLDSVTQISITRLQNAPDRKGNAPDRTANAEPIQRNAQSLKFIIPKIFSSGVYRYDLSGADGSVFGYLNAPTVYWVQGDLGTSSTPGGWVRVFGRNIGRSAQARLMLKSHDGSARELPASRWSLWDASFAIPTDLRSGRYNLSIWNGEGDESTWRKAGTLTLVAPPQQPATTLNVRDFGARGDGRQNDTQAISTALAALANRGGGTLLFPRGRYLLSDELAIPPHVTIRGEARQLVSLNWREFNDPPNTLIDGFSDFSVEDMTLYASDYASVISGGFSRPMDAGDSHPGNIKIANVLIRASTYRGHMTPEQALERSKAKRADRSLNGPVTIRLTGENLTIENSDVYGSGSAFLLFRPHGAYVANNKFYNGRLGWYSITGANGVIFEHNEIIGADMQSTGGGINTLSRDTASSENVYFARNSFSLMHGWDREAVTSDGPGGLYYGRVKPGNGTHLVLTSVGGFQKTNRRTWIGAGFFVVAGAGMGQVGTISEYDGGNEVTLAQPLTVLPDDSSLVTIVPMQRNYLMINNTFTDTGAAVQFYGTSVNHVVSGNTAVRSAGFIDRGLFYQAFQPSWYNQFFNNRILEGNIYGLGGGNVIPAGAVVGVYGQSKQADAPPLVRGIILRRNCLADNAQIEIKGGSSTETPGVVDSIVEKNTIANVAPWIVADKGIRNTSVRDNKIMPSTHADICKQ